MNKNDASGPPFPDLTRAPFSLSSDLSPTRLARELVACFEAVAALERPTRRVFDAVAGAVRLSRDDPLVRAGRELAAWIDGDAPGGSQNAYHNRQHTCEVMLSALLLARLIGLSPPAQRRVLFAALIHDLAHDGTTNRGEPFRLERVAIATAQPLMRRAGIRPAECDRIAALVLATDLDHGAPYARACLRALTSPPAPSALGAADPGRGPLALLGGDAELARQAVLLTEADLLPAVALTPEHALRCQQRLQRENRAIDPTPAARLHFLNEVVPRLQVGRLFTPNLEAQRGALRASLAPLAA